MVAAGHAQANNRRVGLNLAMSRCAIGDTLMNGWHKTIFAGALACSLYGCASTTIRNETFKSYSVGETKTVTVGDAFLTNQDGSVRTFKHWVGIMNSSDGWQTSTEYSTDYRKRELLYGGKSGSTIEVSYREFRGGLAAPAFTQNLKYDLSESKIVRFQNFQLEILQADNQTITYRILKD